MAYERHGMSGTRTYVCWQNMIARCRRHPNYAGRVTVCERWRKFSAFFADMGFCPKGRELDRWDGDGNYEPGNCRWATPLQQRRNGRPSALKKRRKRIRDEFNRQLEGKTK